MLVASLKGNLNLCKKLIKKEKANVNEQSFNGWTPLINASYNGHLEVCKLLIEHKANIDH